MTSFEILAEVAIGVAGFGSIAIVLARDRVGWQSADFFRTAALLLSSLGALFMALLPIGLATAELANEWIWRPSSLIMSAYIIAFSTVSLRWRRRHLDPEHWFGPTLFAIIGVTVVANLIAQVMNFLGLLFPPNPTIYFFGVVWFLGYACLMLARIVFMRPEPR